MGEEREMEIKKQVGVVCVIIVGVGPCSNIQNWRDPTVSLKWERTEGVRELQFCHRLNTNKYLTTRMIDKDMNGLCS